MAEKTILLGITEVSSKGLSQILGVNFKESSTSDESIFLII